MRKYKITLNKRLKIGGVVLVLAVFVFSLISFLYKPKAHAQIFITSGTTWTVPSDWSSANNTIEVIGGGGGSGGGFSDSSGSGGEGGGGGGGGAYSKAINVTLSPGSTVTISIGAAGTAGATGASGVKGTAGGAGGDTYLCSSTINCSSISGAAVVVGAKGGAGGDAGFTSTVGVGGAGGAAASGIGSTKFNGGTGGNGGPTSGGAGGGGGGGAGAAGRTTTGNNGSTPTGITFGSGGSGDGGGGGAGATSSSGAGGNGTEYDATHGSGGGGAGGSGISRGSGSPGGAGGTYGAGGGGGGGNGSKQGSGGAGATGNQGMIRITYNYTVEGSYRWRLDDGNETSGTSLASQNTPATIISNQVARLRTIITNLGDATTFSYALQYSPYVDGCTSWTIVPATATTEHFNMYATANYTDQSASSNVSSGPGVITDPAGYSFTAGKLVAAPSSTATSLTIGANQFTELEFAVQANSNATYSKYCFRVTTSAGTPLDSYQNLPMLNVNYPPSTPTIYSVTNGSTNVPRTPVFQLRSLDYNKDYLNYVVEVCSANSWPCTSPNTAFTYAESDSCWENFDDNSGTAYIGRAFLYNSTLATCAVPATTMLNPNTTYYMRAKAIDPGGSNTYSAYSSVASFTTASLDINITGGTTITGGTLLGN